MRLLSALTGAALAALAPSACSPGSGKGAAPTAEAGVDLERYPAERLDLPRDAVQLVSGTFGRPAPHGDTEGEWAWALGRQGSFQIPIGRPVSGQLAFEARCASYLEPGIELQVRLGERVLGTAELTPKPTELRFDLPPGAITHSGLVRFDVEADRSGRPSEHIEGSKDGRELAFMLSRAWIEADQGPLPSSDSAVEPDRLAPGRLAVGSLLVREGCELVWSASTREPGTLWVGAHDQATGESLSWERFELDAEPIDIAPDLDGLEGHVLQLSAL